MKRLGSMVVFLCVDKPTLRKFLTSIYRQFCNLFKLIMKNIAIIVFFLAFGTLLSAQDVNLSNHSFRLNFLNPGIGGEFQITPNQTLSTNITLVPVLSKAASDSNRPYYFGLLPTFDVEYRFYFNRQQRINRGRSVFKNTGFYIAPRFSYSINPINISGRARGHFDPTFKAGAVVGFQKTFKSNLQLGVHAGAGIRGTYLGTSPHYFIGFNLGYIINRKKRRSKPKLKF